MSKPRQRTKTVAKLFEGRLRLELRDRNPNYYARTFIQKRLIGKSTGERTFGAAKRVAGDWYRTLLAKDGVGESIYAKTFDHAAAAFLRHQDQVAAVSEGQRRNYKQKWSLLKQELTGVLLKDIDLHWLESLRERRSKAITRNETPVAPTTLKKDLLFIRQVLRHAVERERWLDHLPAFPSFTGRRWRILPNPRPFLTHGEYKRLRETAAARMRERDIPERVRAERRELYWMILFCVGGCLRVDEARSLRFSDCQLSAIALEGKKKEPVLLMKVLGKHSPNGRVREDAFGLYGAVSAFKDLRKHRPDAKPEDLLFESHHRYGFRELLKACSLRQTTDGRTRDLKSLRPTGISLRLDLGPKNIDYRAIAKFSRTSPEMIAKFYDQTHPESLLGQVVGFRQQQESDSRKSS